MNSVPQAFYIKNNEMPRHSDGSVEHHGPKAGPITKQCAPRTTEEE